MSLPATDNFNRTEDPLASGWTVTPGAYTCKANGTTAAASVALEVPAGAYWLADAFAANQYAQCKRLGLLAFGGVAGPAVRMATSGAAANGYVLSVGSATILRVSRIDAGVVTQLGDDIAVTTMTTSTVARLEVAGTTLTVKRDGVVVATRTDSTYASGAAGVFFAANRALDDWEGGNLADPQSPVPRAANHYRQMRSDG